MSLALFSCCAKSVNTLSCSTLQTNAVFFSISIHCGEVPMGSNEFEKEPALRKAYQEADCIIQFKPERLGHALLLSNSLAEQLEKRPIPIECCPTSNVMTLELASCHKGNLINGVKKHPQLGRWLENGYPISINTDDAGLFCTNLTRELLLVAQAFGLGEKELGHITMTSLEHAFDPWDELKPRLRTELRKRIEQISDS